MTTDIEPALDGQVESAMTKSGNGGGIACIEESNSVQVSDVANETEVADPVTQDPSAVVGVQQPAVVDDIHEKVMDEGTADKLDSLDPAKENSSDVMDESLEIAIPPAPEQKPPAGTVDPVIMPTDGTGSAVPVDSQMEKPSEEATPQIETIENSIAPPVLNAELVTAAVSKGQEDDDDDDDLFGEGENDEDDEPKENVEMEEVKKVSNDVIVPTSSTTISTEATMAVDSNEGVVAESATLPDPEKSDATTAIASAAIPRKNASAGSSPDAKKKPIMFYTKASLSALGLPDGVNVPYSVDKERLLNNNANNRKMMDTLRSLPVKLVNDALTEYDDAVQVKGNTIRNHGAYLYGVVKRYVAVQERSMAGGDGSGVLPMGDSLTVAVQARLEQLVSTAFCTREEMNDKVKSKIKMLPEKDALFALDELSSVSRSQIRNFGSYFMGILNRYMRGDDNNKSTSGGHFHTSSSPQHKSTMNSYQQQQQPRGRDRNFRDSSSQQPPFSYNSSNERDRSRDRFNKGSDPNDHRRLPSSNPRDSNNAMMHQSSARPPYDNRLQPQSQMPSWQQSAQQQQQQPSMMGYSNPASIRPPGMPEQQQGMMSGVPSANYPSLSQQPQQQYNPLYQQQQQQQPPNSSNPYQPQPQQQSNPSTQFVLSQSYLPGQQQQQPMQYQQPAMAAANQAYGANVGTVQQPYMQQQQPQFQLNLANQLPGQTSTFGRGNNPQQGMNLTVQQPPRWQQPTQQQQQLGQSSTMLPVDILGLADKAASAVQALSSANQMQNRTANAAMLSQTYGGQPQQQQMYNPQSYQQPQQPQQQQQQQQTMYGAVGSTPVLPGQYAPQLAGQMQGTQTMQQQPVQPQQYLQSQQPPQQPANTSHSYLNRPSQAGGGQDSSRSRRTTASLGDLPHGVQFAIQNLIATRAIEGPLDDGILGMIHDLPEALAIASIQKFAALDKSNMRNRTAYLAGVLRRELEKIQRR